MLSKVFLGLFFCFVGTPIVYSESCNEAQCKLALQANDLLPTIDITDSEERVRIVYLYLKVSNSTYDPGDSNEKFRPERWTWAKDIGEPMLSFSYDYDILSLGLLHFQFRQIRVWLHEQPAGCLANLSLYCQDQVIARVLLNDVTKDFSTKMSPKDNVVCGIVVNKNIGWFHYLFEGNIIYRCCNATKTGNQTLVKCDLDVKVSFWLDMFYFVLNYATVLMFIFWPAILLFLPDFLFTFEDKADPDPDQVKAACKEFCCCCCRARKELPDPNDPKETTPLINENRQNKRYRNEHGDSEEITMQEKKPCDDKDVASSSSFHGVDVDASSQSRSSESTPVGPQTRNINTIPISAPEIIPVNDTSPISFTRLVRYCTRNSPLITSDCSKLCFLYYVLFPLVYYYKLVLSLLFKDHHLREEIKIPGARLEGALYAWFFDTVYFDLNVILVRCLVSVAVVFLIVLPGVIIFYIKPYYLQDACSVCRSNPFSLREDIREHLKRVPENIFSLGKYFLSGGCLTESDNVPWKVLKQATDPLPIASPGSRKTRGTGDVEKGETGNARTCFSDFAPVLSNRSWRACTRRCFSKCPKFKCLRTCTCLLPRWFIRLFFALVVVIVFVFLLLLVWGTILAVLISIYLFFFAFFVSLTTVIISPYARFLVFVWRVIRQFVYGGHINAESDDPPKTIPCLLCTLCCNSKQIESGAAKNKQSKSYSNEADEGQTLTDEGVMPMKNIATKSAKLKEERRAEKGETGNAEEIVSSESEKRAVKGETENAEEIVSIGNTERRAEIGGTGNDELSKGKSFQERDSEEPNNPALMYMCMVCWWCSEILLGFLALCWVFAMSIIACLSCRFIVRVIGFVIMGLVLNAKRSTPYITFAYVLVNHTSCYYKQLKTRYKEIKNMISKQWTKLNRDTATDEDTVRLDLFWYVCNECKVLPLVEELSLMFVNVVVFASILFLALAGVVFFGEEYNRSPIVSAAAILISGKLPEWLFKKMIKGENFTDKEKLEKKKKVKDAVDDFKKKLGMTDNNFIDYCVDEEDAS